MVLEHLDAAPVAGVEIDRARRRGAPGDLDREAEDLLVEPHCVAPIGRLDCRVVKPASAKHRVGLFHSGFKSVCISRSRIGARMAQGPDKRLGDSAKILGSAWEL